MATLKQDLLLASAERRLEFLPLDARQETCALLNLGYVDLADIACAVQWSNDPGDVALLLSYFLAMRKGYPCLPLKNECFSLCTSELGIHTALSAREAIKGIPNKQSSLWNSSSSLFSPFKLIDSVGNSFLFSALRAEQWWRLGAACAGGRKIIPLLQLSAAGWSPTELARCIPEIGAPIILELDAADMDGQGLEEVETRVWEGVRRVSAAVLRQASAASLPWIDALLLQNAQAIDLATMDDILRIVPPTAKILLLADGSSLWPPWTILASLFQDAPRGSLEAFVPDLPKPPAIELD